MLLNRLFRRGQALRNLLELALPLCKLALQLTVAPLGLRQRLFSLFLPLLGLTQRLVAPADLDELLGRLFAQRLYFHLKAARRHGKFGAPPVLLGLAF